MEDGSAHLWSGRAGRSPKRVEDARKRADGSPARRAQETSKAYGLHIATGPAVLGMIFLHSTHLGYALSMAVSVSFLASLATGALLGAYPRSPRWDSARRVVLCTHIILSCAGSGFALLHGVTALWY